MDPRADIKRFNSSMGKLNGVYKHYAKLKGISYNTLLVVYSLYDLEDHERSSRTIASYWDIPKQTIYNVLVSMEECGYITKEQKSQDKRFVQINFTKSGLAYAHSLLDDLHKIEIAVINECQEVAEANNRMVTALDTIREFMEEKLEALEHG